MDLEDGSLSKMLMKGLEMLMHEFVSNLTTARRINLNAMLAVDSTAYLAIYKYLQLLGWLRNENHRKGDKATPLTEQEQAIYGLFLDLMKQCYASVQQQDREEARFVQQKSVLDLLLTTHALRQPKDMEPKQKLAEFINRKIIGGEIQKEVTAFLQ